MASPLAIIIPIAPGETAWRELLADLMALPLAAEIVLVATTDDTSIDAVEFQHLASSTPTRLVRAARGRARQLNAGAAATSAPWLWFLHADSRLAPAALAAVARAIERGRPGIGYLDLDFADDGPPWMWLNRIGVWWRCRWYGLPFGDQGFLLTRADFDRLHGYDPAAPFGEDHLLVWAARRAGLGVYALGARITTSARKYAAHGWWATTKRHQQLTWQQAREQRALAGSSRPHAPREPTR